MAKSQERHGDHQSLTPCPTFITMGNKLDEYLFFFVFLSNQRAPKPKKKKNRKRTKLGKNPF